MSTDNNTPDQFRAQVRNPGPNADKGHSVACTVATCTNALWIAANGVRGPGGLPKTVVLKKATQAGWLVRKGGRSITCPTCQGRKPKPAWNPGEPVKGKALPRVVVPLDPAVPVHVVPPGSSSAEVLDALRHTPPPVVADDALNFGLLPDHPSFPDTPTPEQDTHDMRGDFTSDHLKTDTTTPALRRAINAQLHEVHAGECGYLADWSDAKVAKALDCSPAAVAAIREDLFGPDTNEEQRRAAAARDTELAAIRQLLTDGKASLDRGLESLANGDRLYADAMARLAKLEGKT